MSEIFDNISKSRFELHAEGGIVFADYRHSDNVIRILYVETPLSLRGKGFAGHLMHSIMRIAKNQQKKVLPLCSYAAAWVKRHPEFDELTATQ